MTDKINFNIDALGRTYSYNFSKLGEYKYYSTNNKNNTGKITVGDTIQKGKFITTTVGTNLFLKTTELKRILNKFSMYPVFIIIALALLIHTQKDLLTFGQTKIFNDMINATVKLEKYKVSPNENQKLNVRVFDAKTNETIDLSYADLLVKDTYNITTKIFSGLTDETGKFFYTWKIDENAEPGTYTVS